MIQYENKKLLYKYDNSDLENPLVSNENAISNGTPYFNHLERQPVKNKIKWYNVLTNILCIICLLSFPVLEIVFGTLYYRNKYVQCSIMHSMELPLWMIVKGSLNIFVVLYILWAIKIKNIQNNKGEPLNDHPSYGTLISLLCPIMIFIAVLVVLLIAGIATFIVDYCDDLSKNILMYNLMKLGFIFELLKYIFVIPLFKTL
jgi:hypothetical protein